MGWCGTSSEEGQWSVPRTSWAVMDTSIDLETRPEKTERKRGRERERKTRTYRRAAAGSAGRCWTSDACDVMGDTKRIEVNERKHQQNSHPRDSSSLFRPREWAKGRELRARRGARFRATIPSRSIQRVRHVSPVRAHERAVCAPAPRAPARGLWHLIGL